MYLNWNLEKQCICIWIWFGRVVFVFDPQHVCLDPTLVETREWTGSIYSTLNSRNGARCTYTLLLGQMKNGHYCHNKGSQYRQSEQRRKMANSWLSKQQTHTKRRHKNGAWFMSLSSSRPVHLTPDVLSLITDIQQCHDNAALQHSRVRIISEQALCIHEERQDTLSVRAHCVAHLRDFVLIPRQVCGMFLQTPSGETWVITRQTSRTSRFITRQVGTTGRNIQYW